MLKIEESNLKRLIQTTALEWIPLLGGILRIVLEYKFMLKIEESNLKRLIQTTALEWIPL